MKVGQGCPGKVIPSREAVTDMLFDMASGDRHKYFQAVKKVEALRQRNGFCALIISEGGFA